MSNKGNDGSNARVSRRDFLHGFAALGGVPAVLSALDAWGMGIESQVSFPPKLVGNPNGTKVIVLGAGLAGLTAAYELGLKGYDCKVLEARSFSGGRCQTARAGFVLEEIGKPTQTCDFDDGHYFNHAAWRLPMHHFSVIHYCRKFGVQLEIMANINDAGWVMNEKAKGPLNNKRIRRREVKSDMRGYVHEILAKQIDQGKLDGEVTAEDREMLVAYLRRQSELERGTNRYNPRGGIRGYIKAPGAGLDKGIKSTPYGLTELLQSGLGGKFDAVPEMLRAHNLLQPVGGMDQIAKGIERQLRPEQIAHNMEVREIRQDDNGVRVVCKNTGTGETFTETGDYCFATIPPTILSTIPGDWSTDIQKALETPRGVPVGKLAVQMNRRFWEEDDGIFGGYSHVDFTGVDKIFYPSYGLLGKKGVVQCYYNYRSTAIKMSNRSLEAKVKFALDNGEKVHPGLFRKHYDNKAFSVDWHLQKYSLGGWDAWTMQEREEHFPKLLEPQGRIVFAGNYLSNFGAWQAGAVESSWQQLEKLHARAMTDH